MAERTESVGQIGLDLVVNRNEFEHQMTGIRKLAKKVGGMLAGAFAVKKLADFGKSCLELGSDLAEVQNVVDVTFSSISSKVDEFAKNAITTYGLSETMAKKFTGTFGAMSKAFGFTEQQAYDMGTTLTGLAGDVASFYNKPQDEAYTKLKSVFTGETESLKDLGVVMTQSALDAYALANGFGKTTQKMSEAEKVALRYQFVQDKLAAAQGDFARTSGSWANQVRILKLQFDSLKATIGQGLINLFTPVIRVINTIIGKLATLANAFKAFTELITGNKSSGSTGGIPNVASAAAEAGTGLDTASAAADNLTDSTTKAGKAAKKAAQEMRNLMGFDQINKLTEATDTSTDTGSGGNTAGTGSLGSAVNFGSLAKGETTVDKLDSKFTKLFTNIKKLSEPAIQSLKRLWSEGLSKLGNFTWKALQDFYNHFLVPVGKWTLGTGIPRFIEALNNGLMKVNFQKINTSLRRLWDVLAPFAIHVGEGLLWFWENVLVPLGTWTANEVVPRFLDTLSIVIGALNHIIEALQPLFQWFWDNVLKKMAEWTGGIFLKVWDKINTALQKFSDWCAENPETIQSITIVLAAFAGAWALVSGAIGIWNTVAAIAATVTKALGIAIGFLTSPIGIATIVIGGLIAAGVALYKNWDKVKEKAGELKDWLIEKTRAMKERVTRGFNTLKENIADAMYAIKTDVSEKWSSAKTAFSNILTYVKGAFLTGWTRAWTAVKTKFSEIFGSLKNLAKKPINAVISLINSLISKINSGIEDIEEAFSFKYDFTIPFAGRYYGNYGISLPRVELIPTLAQGGYVKPNTPQLAMIGDNRHQGEIVAPEDKLLEMATLAAKAAAGEGGSAQVLAVLAEILRLIREIKPVTIDEEALRKYFIEKTNQNTRAGKQELIM